MARRSRHLLLVLAAALATLAPAAHAAPPTNDNFANATPLSGAPVSATGTTVDATEEPGEPVLGESWSQGRSVWYRWTAPSTGMAVFDTSASGFETQLGVYTGGALNTLTPLPGLQQNWPSYRARPRGRVTAGTTYWIAVEGYHYSQAGDLSLRITVGDPPANDMLAAAQLLTGTEASTSTDLSFATSEAGEPYPGAATSVWYRWTAPGDGGLALDTQGAEPDTVLSVYTGETLASLTKAAESDDRSSTDRSSRVAFRVKGGTTYLIRVIGKGAGAGRAPLNLRLTPPPPNDLLAAAADLGGAATAGATGTLLGASTEVGEPSHDPNYTQRGGTVWYSWTAPHRGSLTLKATAGFQAVLAVYRGSTPAELVRVRNQPQNWNGGPEQIRIRVEAGETYRIAIGARYGESAEFSIALNLIPSPLNDDFADAIPLAGTLAEFAGSTVGATQEPCEPFHDGNYYDPSVWFTWTATVDGGVTLDTTGSDFTAILAVYTGADLCGITPVPVTRLTDANVPAKRTFRAEAGVTYRIVIDGVAAQMGNYKLTLRHDPPPPNDLFEDAEPLTGASATARGTTLGARVEPGEPTSGDSRSHSVWYSWTAPTTGATELRLSEPAPARVWEGVSVYEGDSVGSLRRVVRGDGSARFQTRSGRTYRIAVDNYGVPLQGGFKLDLEHAPPRMPNDDFADAIDLAGPAVSVPGSTAGATSEDGEPQHTDSDHYPASVWYRWKAPASGQLKLTGRPVAVYTGNTLTGLTSVPVDQYSHTAWVDAGVTYTIAVVGGVSPSSGDFTVQLSFLPSPPNDRFTDADPLTGPAVDVTGSLVRARREAGEPLHDTDGYGPSVWYAWTAPSDGVVAVDVRRTSGSEYSSFEPEAAVYTGSRLTDLTLVSSGSIYRRGFRARGGVTYWIAVASDPHHDAQTFRLRLTHEPGPDNDMFADAIELSGHSDSARGSNLAATQEPGEPDPHYTRASIWYRWTAPTSGRTTLHVTGPGTATNRTLDAYTGERLDALSPVATSSTRSGGRSFQAVAGTTYQFALDGYYWGDEGPLTIKLEHSDAPANDAFSDAVRLSGSSAVAQTHTAAATVEPGEPSHYGSPTGSVWYRWRAPDDGMLRVDWTGKDQGYAIYSGSTLGTLTRLTSSGGVRSVVPVKRGTEYAIAVDRQYGDGAPGELRLEHVGPPPNDSFASAQELSGQTATADGHNFEATREAGEPSHGGFYYGRSIWYRWQAPATGPVTLDASSSEVSPLLGVYTGDAVDRLTTVGWTYGSAFRFDAVEGRVYRIALDGAYNAAGKTRLSLRLDPTPPSGSTAEPPPSEPSSQPPAADPPSGDPAPGEEPPTAGDPPPGDPPSAQPEQSSGQPPSASEPQPSGEGPPPAHDVGSPPSAAPPTGSPEAPPPLRVLAAFPKQRLADVLARGLTGTATCSAGCRVAVTVTVDPAAAKKVKLTGSRVTTARASAAAGTTPARLLVRLPKASLKKLRAMRSLPLTVTVVATSAARGGERAEQTLRLNVKR
jgi:hypothetical protein